MASPRADLNELAAQVQRAGAAAALDPRQRRDYAGLLLEFADLLFLGREYGDCAQASADAMQLFITLGEQGERCGMELGASIRRHADALVELGRELQAEELYRRALGIFGSFGREELDAQGEFAGTLLNYGACLAALGRGEQALERLDEARELLGMIGFDKSGDPTQLPNLALSQVQRGRALVQLGRGEEALAALREAEGIYGEFANSMPELYGQRLAEALDVRASVLRQLGRSEEAVVSGERALGVLSRLARADPPAFIAPLSRVANNLGRSLQQAGRPDEAVSFFARAGEGFTLLADAQPEAYTSTLVSVISNHALALAQLGRLSEAYEAATRAVERTRAVPGLEPRLIGGLHFLAQLARDLDREQDAVACLSEALPLAHTLAAALPDDEELRAATLGLCAELRELGERPQVELSSEARALIEELRGPAAPASPSTTDA